MSAAKRMMALFEGSSEGHGKTTVGRVTRTGKTEANSRVIREPMTETLMQSHLDGAAGIGAIPINKDNMCRFGALDIDSYDLDIAGLARKVASLKLPLFVCRSKSGGAHMFLFLRDWEPAALVREYLTEMSVVLGYSGCEIFPKQDKILSERGDVGNFINLPYFNAEMTTRYSFNSSGEALTLEEFIEAAERGRVSVKELNALDFGGERKFFVDGPPCLEVISSQGPVTTNRNIFMFNVGVYCRNKYGDDWKPHHEEFNTLICSPALPAGEIVNIQKSLERNGKYYYQCDQCPLKDFCDKSLCKKRPYGVGGGGGTVDLPQLGGLTIMLSEPRLYFMDVNGQRVQLGTEQLQNPTLWQRACMDQIQTMPPVPKAAQWQQVVSNLMEQATQLDVPEELTVRGQFRELLKMYCTSRIRAVVPEELEMGKPYTDNGITKFTMAGLSQFLKNRGFTSYTRAQIQEQIKDLNGGGPCHGVQNIRLEDGKRAQIRVWWVPAFEDNEVALPKMEVESEYPF